MEYTIALDTPFSLDHTLLSGQAFRWQKKGDRWFGVVSGEVFSLAQEGETLRCASLDSGSGTTFILKYFRLDEDLRAILASFPKDRRIGPSLERFYGMRVLRQDKWECLASFLLATNANIPRIRKMVADICAEYGEVLQFEGEEFHSFPGPEKIAAASASDLRRIGLGYRAPFLRHVAAAVASGRFDLDAVARLPYEDARESLLTKLLGEKALLGVGPKVADCFLLYSCDMSEAFPVDVWIARILSQKYPRMVPQEVRRRMSSEGAMRLSRKEYYAISKAARKHFGPNAGCAQLYLYMDARIGEGQT